MARRDISFLDMHLVYRYPEEVAVETRRADRWLRPLQGTATFVFIAALCLAVAVLVIGLIPGSPVSLQLPGSVLSGTGPVTGVDPSATVDPDGFVAFAVAKATLGQRLLLVVTMLPGLLLVAELARRVGRLLRRVAVSDPFTAGTAQELSLVAKVTAFGGLGVWAVGVVARWALSATVLDGRAAVSLDRSLLGWLAVSLVFAAFAQVIGRGAVLRAELDTVI
jgi:hypothetical protein